MTATETPLSTAVRIQRVEVRPKPGEPDPRGAAVLRAAQSAFPVTAVRTAAVFLIESELTDEQLQRIASELLGDPVSQQTTLGGGSCEGGATIEVHYLPGVMDPVAQSTREAILEMLPESADSPIEVRTGLRYDLVGCAADHEQLKAFAQQHLANTVIQDIRFQPYLPEALAHGSAYELDLLHVPIRELDDDALMKLSRHGHLFLSLPEMRAIRGYYKDADREPTDIELETLAQTWSEHCVHKTLKSTINFRSEIRDQKSEINFRGRPGHTVNPDGSVTIDNLLKSTVAAATMKLMEEDHFRGWCVSVFEDNSGVVKFDDDHGVCIKVETHNHPSAIEPYGGAATGIGGCIRDVIGTGLAAQPIANTDVFAVAPPEVNHLPKGVIHPKRILEQVVAGVRDYGNRMGIPTVNGAVRFDEKYLGNPLVFAGCVGLIPLDKCFGSARAGDRIFVLGGRTGRDGIHGATFSSAELTDSHADEFSHAVQIGNPITEKKMLDVILQARDADGGPLFSAITDCGAGGFSSAVGEMGEKVGAVVELEHAPLKYAGLRYTEIWISEAQERMVLAVPPEHVEQLRTLCAAEDVECCELGVFGHEEDGEPTLLLKYDGQEVGRLSMTFLHHGLPMPTREATWTPPHIPPASAGESPRDLQDALFSLLAHPNIASKHWIIRQYDHEVQGGSVVKPLVGPEQDGPSDAAVLRPKLDSRRGIALACGMAPQLSETCGGDSYWATLAAIDEAVRNAVCVGADPKRIAILDNFCWPSCDDPEQLGTLVRAAEACYDGALAYRTPFVSGKDSLNNQFTTDDGRVIAIPQTLLITALGIVPDVRRCVTMDAKQPGNLLMLIGATDGRMGGSHYRMLGGSCAVPGVPHADLDAGPRNARAVAALIERGLVRAAHDCSDGGLLVAAAEMAFAGRIGLELDLAGVPTADELDPSAACFAETPSRYLLEITPADADAVIRALLDAGVVFAQVGRFTNDDRLRVRSPHNGRLLDAELDALRAAWTAPLDW